MINNDIKIWLITEQKGSIEAIIAREIKNAQKFTVNKAKKELVSQYPHIIIFNSISIDEILSFRQQNYNTRFILIQDKVSSDVSQLALCQVSSLIDSDSFDTNVLEKELNQVINELESIQKKFLVQLDNNYAWQVNDKILYDGYYQHIDLSKNERILLDYFIRKANKTLNSYSIIDQLNLEEGALSIKSLRNIILKLRKKLPRDSIQSVYGEGYIFRLQRSRTRISLNDFQILNNLLAPLTTIEQAYKAFCDTLLKLYETDRSFVMYVDTDTDHIIVPYEASRDEYPGAAKLEIKIPITKTQRNFFNQIIRVNEPYILGNDDMKGLKKEDPVTWATMVVPKSALVFYFKAHNISWIAGLHQCSHQRHWTQEEVIFLKHSVKILQEKMQKL